MAISLSKSISHQNKRVREIKKVLWVILGLNLLVAFAKLFWGLFSGSAAMTADGFHSMFDGTSNVVGLIGMTFAARPADDDHPYGHSKYETYSAVMIAAMLLFAAYSIGSEAVNRLMGHGQPPQVTATSFAIMFGTLLVNFFVTTYERRVGKRLNSEILIADASHTASDILVSLGVIVSLILVKFFHLMMADAIVSLLIAGAIVYTAWGVFKQASATLSDSARIPEEGLEACIRSVPGILDIHHVRTRGTESEVYVDLHIMVDPYITVKDGHRIAHEVEECIEIKYPQAIDVIVHVEPYMPEEAYGQKAEKERLAEVVGKEQSGSTRKV